MRTYQTLRTIIAGFMLLSCGFFTLAQAEEIYMENFNQAVSNATGRSLHDAGVAPSNATGWRARYESTSSQPVTEPVNLKTAVPFAVIADSEACLTKQA